MTYQFRLQEEPFNFESDYGTEMIGTEWESKVNRKSPDYIKWVQQSLNQIMGLRLAVNGDAGPHTHSAIRSFQQKQGLKVDGIVGEKTEAAIKAVSNSRGSIMPPPPQLSVYDYAELANHLLSRACRDCNKKFGIVVSVVQLIPSDHKPMIDLETIRGPKRPRLKNPPAQVMLPAEIYEIVWKKVELRFIWILSNPKSVFPVGGVLFLPWEDSVSNDFYLVTFNTGSLDDSICTNVHHAEMQFTSWIEAQPKPWQSRVGVLDIWNLSRKKGLGYSPCSACCDDLTHFLRNLRNIKNAPVNASLTWLQLYNGNKACGHPTTLANLQKLAASGWRLRGEGWSQHSHQVPPGTSPKPDIVKVRGILVARQIAPKIEALLTTAQADGLLLSGRGYRTPGEQIELRKKNCGASHYDIWDKLASKCKPPTARPGHSMHEKGLAIDFTHNGRLISSQHTPGFQWMAHNAARFGLKNLPSEPWHWSVNGQ